MENICNTLNVSLSTFHVTATLYINEMKLSVFGVKDTTTKSLKMVFAMNELRYTYVTLKDI